MSAIKSVKGFWNKSIRRQLVLGIALVHAVMMTIFVFDLVNRQSDFLVNQSLEQTKSLVRTISANSIPWVLANDVVGLEEIIQSIKSYPGLRYIMVTTPEGKVLGHNNSDHVGEFLTDPTSKQMLSNTTELHILYSDVDLQDVAVPIMSNNTHIGWVRAGIGGETTRNGLQEITRDGAVYTFIAILVGTLFAFIMARGITFGLNALIDLTSRIREGDIEHRSELNRHDEIGDLAQNFNHMLDVLHKQQDDMENVQSELKRHRDELEQKVALRTHDLKQARDEALQAASAKTTFLSNMSHELRTPLNSIIGFTSIVKDEMAGPVNETQKKQLEIAHDSAKHLLSIINEILDLRRIEEGKFDVNYEEICVNDLLDVVVDTLAPQAEEKGLKLSMEKECGVLNLESDRAKLFQILLNIVGNAIKFTDRGEVCLSCRKGKDGVRIVVKDTGIGIKKEEQSAVFDAFTQAEGGDARAHEGSGLGLTITKQFVELLGGFIKLESEFGKGTTCTIWLPASPSSVNAIQPI